MTSLQALSRSRLQVFSSRISVASKAPGMVAKRFIPPSAKMRRSACLTHLASCPLALQSIRRTRLIDGGFGRFTDVSIGGAKGRSMMGSGAKARATSKAVPVKLGKHAHERKRSGDGLLPPQRSGRGVAEPFEFRCEGQVSVCRELAAVCPHAGSAPRFDTGNLAGPVIAQYREDLADGVEGFLLRHACKMPRGVALCKGSQCVSGGNVRVCRHCGSHAA